MAAAVRIGKCEKGSNHASIQRWVEQRGGCPATITDTSETGEESGVLRVEFPGHGAARDGIRHIDWNEFFDKFEHENLAFLHQNQTEDGQTSRFCKLMQRN